MKILFYSARADQQTDIRRWSQKNGVEVDTTQEILNAQTVALAKGYDGIVVQQHEKIADQTIYQQLAQFGIHHIALGITGYDIIDFSLAKQNQIVVTNVPAYSPRSVAEEVLAHTMALLRHLKRTHRMMVAHNFGWADLEAVEIHDLTIGVVGLGKIGYTVARIFSALGARVIAFDTFHRTDVSDIVEYVDFQKLLEQSDVISIHTGLSDATRHLFGTKEFSEMKKNALLINCARGPIVDIAALITALKEHQIAGAGLDTFEGDATILGNDLRNQSGINYSVVDTLLAMDNVIVTPHIGFYTEEAVTNMVTIALDTVKKVNKGEKVLNFVQGE